MISSLQTTPVTAYTFIIYIDFSPSEVSYDRNNLVYA